MDCKPTRAPGPFDIAALRERYRHERDKRKHPRGQDQYTEVSDGYDDFYEVDPLLCKWLPSCSASAPAQRGEPGGSGKKTQRR